MENLKRSVPLFGEIGRVIERVAVEFITNVDNRGTFIPEGSVYKAELEENLVEKTRKLFIDLGCPGIMVVPLSEQEELCKQIFIIHRVDSEKAGEVWGFDWGKGKNDSEN